MTKKKEATTLPRLRTYTLNLTEGELAFFERTAAMYRDRVETPYVLKPLIGQIVEKCVRARAVKS